MIERPVNDRLLPEHPARKLPLEVLVHDTLAPTALRRGDAKQAKGHTARKLPSQDAKLSVCRRNPEEFYDAN